MIDHKMEIYCLEESIIFDIHVITESVSLFEMTEQNVTASRWIMLSLSLSGWLDPEDIGRVRRSVAHVASCGDITASERENAIIVLWFNWDFHWITKREGDDHSSEPLEYQSHWRFYIRKPERLKGITGYCVEVTFPLNNSIWDASTGNRRVHP